MNRRALAGWQRAATQGFAGTLGGLLVGLLLSVLTLYVPALLGAVVFVIALLIVFTLVNRGQERREAARIEEGWRALPLDQARFSRIESLVSTFDRAFGVNGRPAPIITLLEQLPTVTSVRLVVSQEVAGKLPATDRVAELESWLTKKLDRKVDVSISDVRLPAFDFDDGASRLLRKDLEAMEQLPGLCVDVTAGTTPMSITLMQAAEDAGVPVTYLPQSPLGPSDWSFQGIAVLSDPDGRLTVEVDAEVDA